MQFGKKRRRFIAGQLLILSKEFRILKSLSKGALDDLYTIFGCSRREHKRSSRDPKSARHLNQLSFKVRLGKAFELWNFGEIRMFLALGDLKDCMKVHR